MRVVMGLLVAALAVITLHVLTTPMHHDWSLLSVAPQAAPAPHVNASADKAPVVPRVVNLTPKKTVSVQAPYVVKHGDTLWAIGLRVHRSWQALVAANHIPNPNLIFAGQVIQIPS